MRLPKNCKVTTFENSLLLTLSNGDTHECEDMTEVYGILEDEAWVLGYEGLDQWLAAERSGEYKS